MRTSTKQTECLVKHHSGFCREDSGLENQFITLMNIDQYIFLFIQCSSNQFE